VDVDRFATKLDRSIEVLEFYRSTPELLGLSAESQGLLVEIDRPRTAPLVGDGSEGHEGAQEGGKGGNLP
jgi:hypothetical protein